MSRNEDKRSDVDQVERIVPFMRQKMSFMLSKKKNRRGGVEFKLKSKFFGKKSIQSNYSFSFVSASSIC